MDNRATRYIVDNVRITGNSTFSGKIWRTSTSYVLVKGRFKINHKDGKQVLSVPLSWIYGVKSINLIDLDDLTGKVQAEYDHEWFSNENLPQEKSTGQ